MQFTNESQPWNVFKYSSIQRLMTEMVKINPTGMDVDRFMFSFSVLFFSLDVSIGTSIDLEINGK